MWNSEILPSFIPIHLCAGMQDHSTTGVGLLQRGANQKADTG